VGGRRRPGRGIALVAVVATALALSVPNIASGSQVIRNVALPPPDSCAAPILPCYIVLSIGSGSHGNNETVTGARFWPGEPFTVYFWNGEAGAPAAIVGTGASGSSGGFTAYFPVPKDPVGNYTVFVADLAGDNQSAPFHLDLLSARPNSGAIGGSTALSGQGFLADHTVKFRLHGAHASTTARCETNRYGNFSNCRITIADVPTGSTRLTATDGTYIARIEFVVN
jgi:hypothetical protein